MNTQHSLKRSVTLPGLLFAAVGGIVGSGWLFGPYFAARLVGPASIFAWMLGGCLMMVVALTFAELTSTFPMTGGTARFLQLSHGPLVSFAMAWIAWLSSTAVAPIETFAILHYVTTAFPGLMREVGHEHVLSPIGLIVAASILFLMCFINLVGARFLTKFNNGLVVLKLLVPTVTIVVLLSLDFHSSNFTSAGFAPAGFQALLSALPYAGIIFSFIGYSPAVQLAGEAKNPQRAMPIAIIGALLICIVLYVFLQIAFIGALPASSLVHGWQHLHFSADSGPFVGLMMAVGVVWFSMVIFADAMISPFGTGLMYTTSSSRMCYAMSQNGYFPQFLLKVNRFGIPGRILVLNFVVGLFLFLPFPTWHHMVSFLVSAMVLAYAVGPLSLIVLRKALPDYARPFRIPAAKWTCLLAFYICNLIVLWSGWAVVSKTMAAVLLGYVVLMLYKQTERGRALDLQWQKSWWVFFYLGILAMLSFLGTYGQGRGVIPFGWDFLAVAIVTWLIYELSQRCALEAEQTQKHLDDFLE